MKIALPSNNDQIDSHFGHCQYFTIIEVDADNNIISQDKFDPPAGCGCKSNVIPQLKGMGVEVMLAGNMGQGAVNVINANGIKVVRGLSGNVRQAVENYIDGNVQDSGATCSDHDSCS